MSDITDEQWELLKGFIPAAKTGGRPRKVEVREVVNAIFYILSAGCPWRMLPHDFPVWQRRALVGSPDVKSVTRQTVYEYFRNWRIEKIWEPINRQFNQWIRVSGGKDATPSVAITLRGDKKVKRQAG
jgi:putative transposase